MKLISLNDHPELKEVFCSFGNRVLSDADKPYAMKPEYVAKILELKFPVHSEAFFFEDPTGEFFGRILLQESVNKDEMGHFGLFCLSPLPKHQEMFLKLWPQIEDWFKSRGVKKIVGPYLYTTFFPYRFRADKLPERYAWEPNQPASDLEAFRSIGFKNHEVYFSNFIENYGVFATKGTRELEEATQKGFRMRAITPESIEQDVKIIYDLSMKGFTGNYLFAPIPYELFKSIYIPSFKMVDLRLSCIQEDAQGNPAGFNFTFIMDNQIVIKSVCTSPDYRGMGLFNAGLRYAILKAKELFPQVTTVVAALIHDENTIIVNVADDSKDLSRHEYVLLSKDIE